MIKIDLLPFNAWPERALADPRRANQAQFMDGLLEILTYEAQIQGLNLFQSYARAGGLQKITQPVRARFVQAIKQSEKDGQIVIERENDTEIDGPDDPRGWIIRLPDQEQVKMRDLGSRGFSEIPLGELAALVLEIRCQDEFMGREDIARTILDHYGLQKLTALVQRRLDRVFSDYF